MSASVHDPLHADRTGRAVWLALSLLFHGLLLAWLIFLVPAVEIATISDGGVIPAETLHASPDRIREVAVQVEATQADEVRSKVEELLATRRELAQLEEQTLGEFSGLAADMAAGAPERVAQALDAAAAAQQRALEAQDDAAALTEEMRRGGDRLAAEAGAVLESRAVEARNSVKEAQTAAAGAQATALQQLEFQAGVEPAREALLRAIEAQGEANIRQDEASAAASSLESLARRTEKAAQNAERAALAAEHSRQKVEAAKRGLDQLRGSAERVRDSLEKATDARVRTRIQRDVDGAARRVANAEKDLVRLEARAAADQAKSEAAAGERNVAETERAAAPARSASTEAAARQAQAAAGRIHAQARETVLRALSDPAAVPAGSMTDFEPVRESPLTDGSFADWYSLAVATEKDSAERYRAIRAAQVAIQKQIPLSEARKYVQVAVPLRAEAPDVATPVETAEALAARNEAMEKALKELESMRALTRGMAAQAQATAAGPQGVSITLESLKGHAALQGELAALGAENENQIAVDLAGLMRQAGAGSLGLAGGGAPGSAGGGAGGRPGFGGSGPASGAPSFSPTAVAGALPGRKIHGSGHDEGGRWMFVDSWWVIGPFPNPARRNIETRFPPESVVDLDARYAVGDGTVRWEFVQTATPRVRPPHERSYSIYYAYSELWLDEARDLWIAVGSDDYSKVWINDLPVWSSGLQHKPWKANEGFRKVHFKKGLNRILMRIENGQSVCMFSLMIQPQSGS